MNDPHDWSQVSNTSKASGTVKCVFVLPGAGSILVLGEPGVGKTSILREMARHLSTGIGKRVLVIDTSNEIGGGGDTPHPAIGDARRMMVSTTSKQSEVMVSFQSFLSMVIETELIVEANIHEVQCNPCLFPYSLKG